MRHDFMGRALALCLALMMVLALGACGKKDDPNVPDIDKGGPVGPQNPPKDIGMPPGAHGGHATPGAGESASPESEPEARKPSFDYMAKPATLGELTGYADYVQRRLEELNGEKIRANEERFKATAEKMGVKPGGAWGNYSAVDKDRVYSEIGDKEANKDDGQVMGYLDYAQLGNIPDCVYGWDYLPADDQCDLIMGWMDPEDEDHEWFMLNAYYGRYAWYLVNVKQECGRDYRFSKDGDASTIPQFPISEEEVLAAWQRSVDERSWRPVTDMDSDLAKAMSGAGGDLWALREKEKEAG